MSALHGVVGGAMLERAAMDLLDTRRPRLLLVGFCLLTWLPGLFSLPPTDRDESRFAQASKQMIETDDYVRIMNGAEPRNRKPIGIYWLQVPFAVAARAAGLARHNPIWPYRLPSLGGGMLAVLAVFELGQALVGRRAALLAGGMLAGSLLLIVEVHLAKTDAALLGATTVAMGLLARCYRDPAGFGPGRAAGFWLAVAAGVLLKGPITPMVAALAAGTLVVCDRRADWLRALRAGWGVPLAVLAVSPWFVAIGLTTHGAFFRDAVGGDLAAKLTGGDDSHGAPPGLHLLLLPILALPAGVAVLRAIPAAWHARREATTRFLLAWAVPSWAVFEAVPTKLPHYALPLYPAVFLLAARFALAPAQPGRYATTARVLMAAIFAGVAVGAVVIAGWIGDAPWEAAPAVLAVAIAGWLTVRNRSSLGGLAAMPLVTLALLGWELPRSDALWLAPKVAMAVHAAGLLDGPLGAVGFHEPSLMFLEGTNTAMLATGPDGAAALASGQVATVVVGDRDERAFQGAAARIGLVPRALATVEGFNYSRGRRTRLTLYTGSDGDVR